MPLSLAISATEYDTEYELVPICDVCTSPIGLNGGLAVQSVAAMTHDPPQAEENAVGQAVCCRCRTAAAVG